jgi:hypothetical protein
MAKAIKAAIEQIKAFDTLGGKLVFQPNHAAVMDIEVGVSERRQGRSREAGQSGALTARWHSPCSKVPTS